MQDVLNPASLDAAIIARMAWLLFGGAALIFAGVMLLAALALRRRGELPADARRRALRPGLWLIGGGLALPVLVLSSLLSYSTLRSAQLSTPSSRQALVVAVTAKMWWWEVRYRNPAGGADVVLANELHVPVGQAVYLALDSADVIHSFWVPALAGKVDMVPGRIHGLTVRVDQAGVYRGQCAEYCGVQHARMALHVIAQPPADFALWLAAQARPAQVVGPGSPATLAQGRAVFLQRCAGCHAIRGVTQASARTVDGGALGPDLTHVGSRRYLAAGTLRNQPGAFAAWIADPHALKPGVRMPAATGIDGAALHALAAYLEQLQ